MKTSGIYSITNTTNGKRYVGSSGNIEKRFRSHKRLLSKGKHPNIHLQRAWVRDGEQAFTFSIIELCEPADLIAKEQSHIDIRADYNIIPKAYDPPTFRGLSHSPETRAKMSAAQTGEKHAMYGKHHTAEAKEKIRLAGTGKKYPSRKPLSPEALAKISAANTGRKHTPETRARMSAAAEKLWSVRHESGAVVDVRAEKEKKRLRIEAKPASDFTRAEWGSARAYKAWETKRAKEKLCQVV